MLFRFTLTDPLVVLHPSPAWSFRVLTKTNKDVFMIDYINSHQDCSSIELVMKIHVYPYYNQCYITAKLEFSFITLHLLSPQGYSQYVLLLVLHYHYSMRKIHF